MVRHQQYISSEVDARLDEPLLSCGFNVSGDKDALVTDRHEDDDRAVVIRLVDVPSGGGQRRQHLDRGPLAEVGSIADIDRPSCFRLGQFVA